MNRWASSAGWALALVAASLGAAYAFDAAGLQWPARLALVPVSPVLLTVIGVAGGFHAASGETRWMVVTGLVSILVWWAIIGGWRAWRTER
jgi:hypothetical protein